MTRFIRPLFLLSLLCCMFSILCVAEPAYAKTLATSCISTDSQDGRYVQKVISCINDPLRASVISLLSSVSDYMKPVIASLTVLAVVFFGIRIMAGEHNSAPFAFGFALRMGLVLMFSANLGGYASGVFGIFDQLIALVSGAGFNPWERMDEFIGKMLGFAPGMVTANGLLGLMAGAVFSSNFGFMVALAGISGLLGILRFLFRIVYMYVASLVTIGFLIVISPIIIPVAIFRYGDRFVSQWLSLLYNAFLTPMLIFAFLSIFIGILGDTGNDIIPHIFEILGCDYNNLSECKYLHQSLHDSPIFSWLTPTDADLANHVKNLAADPNTTIKPSIQVYANPYVGTSFDANIGNIPTIDFGTLDASKKKELFYALIELWLFMTLFISILDRLPEVAKSISGGGDLNMYKFAKESGIEQGLGAMKNKLGGKT